ncbi:MAG: GIY-YIG nuclease family protein [Pseudomonadota bacterium]
MPDSILAWRSIYTDNQDRFPATHSQAQERNVTDNIPQITSTWYVYLIRTRSGSLYAGITTDTERRLREHHKGGKGAKNLRGKGPLELVYREQFANRSIASVLEARIKKLTRPQKEALITGGMHWSQLMEQTQV